MIRDAVERLCDGNTCGGVISAGNATGISGMVSAPEFSENCLSLLSDKAFSPKLDFEAMRFAEDEECFRIL